MRIAAPASTLMRILPECGDYMKQHPLPLLRLVSSSMRGRTGQDLLSSAVVLKVCECASSGNSTL